MRIPNAENAFVDINKLIGYVLNSEHRDGQHKARVFQAAFGITASNADMLQRTLLEKVKTESAHLGLLDDYGQRYRLDFDMFTSFGQARVRSAWIIRLEEDFPRLLTCFVIVEEAGEDES